MEKAISPQFSEKPTTPPCMISAPLPHLYIYLEVSKLFTCSHPSTCLLHHMSTLPSSFSMERAVFKQVTEFLSRNLLLDLVHTRLPLGSPEDACRGRCSLPYTQSGLGQPSAPRDFSYHCYADDTQLYLLFPPDKPLVTDKILNCLSTISAGMQDHHLQLNLAKTEVIFPANQYIHHDTDIKIGTLSLAHTKPGTVIDDQLTFPDRDACVSCPSRFQKKSGCPEPAIPAGC